jgi:ankyrin repeat protein
MLVNLCREKGSKYLIEKEIMDKNNLDAQDKRGMTALMFTCKHKDYLNFSKLLEAGADINIKNSYDTVLSYACRKKYSKFAKLLLQKKNIIKI